MSIRRKNDMPYLALTRQDYKAIIEALEDSKNQLVNHADTLTYEQIKKALEYDKIIDRVHKVKKAAPIER
jgi:5-bromo-4-chloroindolyl phosphate hydrolysis protein